MAMGMQHYVGRAVATKIVAVDGTGDFTDIQKAINALPSTGGVVYIKEGTYTISSSITFPHDNISLFGSGKSTIIYLANNSDCTMINIQHTNSTIKDVSLDGNKTNQSSNTAGISINANYGIVENCFLNNIGGRGINLYGDNAKITNNLITNSGYGGLHITTNNSVILGNTSKNNQYGLYMWSTTGYNAITNIIIGNLFTNNSVHGILLYVITSGSNVDENVIAGNICNSNSSYGIYITSKCTKNIILNNIILNNTSGQFHDDGTSTQLGHNITS